MVKAISNEFSTFGKTTWVSELWLQLTKSTSGMCVPSFPTPRKILYGYIEPFSLAMYRKAWWKHHFILGERDNNIIGFPKSPELIWNGVCATSSLSWRSTTLSISLRTHPIHTLIQLKRIRPSACCRRARNEAIYRRRGQFEPYRQH